MHQQYSTFQSNFSLHTTLTTFSAHDRLHRIFTNPHNIVSIEQTLLRKDINTLAITLLGKANIRSSKQVLSPLIARVRQGNFTVLCLPRCFGLYGNIETMHNNILFIFDRKMCKLSATKTNLTRRWLLLCNGKACYGHAWIWHYIKYGQVNIIRSNIVNGCVSSDHNWFYNRHNFWEIEGSLEIQINCCSI